jgi:hypothetical protein
VAYRLKTDHPITQEVKRIVHKQLTLAAGRLSRSSDTGRAEAVHVARRHIKKVRALIRLVRPALAEDVYAPSMKRLREASRLLAPISDGDAVVQTVDRMLRENRSLRQHRTLGVLRAALIARKAGIHRKAALDRAPSHAAAALRILAAGADDWQLRMRGVRTVSQGFEHAVRKARKAMRRALAEPTAEHYHAWRKRVKDVWFHLRLIEGRCGGRLRTDQRDFERLDGYLGEHHNVLLLERVVMTEGLLTRSQAAECLPLLRRYQRELERRAGLLGMRVLSRPPRQLARRVQQEWQSAKSAGRTDRAVTPWRRAA